MIVAAVVLVVIASLFVGFLVRERRMRMVAGGRIPGFDAFFDSLAHGTSREPAKHFYDALHEHSGSHVTVVRGDDDLCDLYGIVDEDIDDVMLEAARRANVSSEALSKACKDRRVRTAKDAVDVLMACMPVES